MSPMRRNRDCRPILIESLIRYHDVSLNDSLPGKRDDAMVALCCKASAIYMRDEYAEVRQRLQFS